MTKQKKIEKLAKGMGWHKRFSLTTDNYYDWVDSDEKFIETMLWNPLESWNDAGMIIERMEELGYYWRIGRGYTFSSPGDLPPYVKASFWSGTNPYQAGTYESISAKEAICEAALKTLEVRDERV